MRPHPVASVAKLLGVPRSGQEPPNSESPPTGRQTVESWDGGHSHNALVVLTFEDVTLISPRFSIFVAKYDLLGNFRGVRQVGGATNAGAVAIAIDAARHVYLAGRFGDFGEASQILSFGSSTIATKASSDAFIARLNAP